MGFIFREIRSWHKSPQRKGFHKNGKTNRPISKMEKQNSDIAQYNQKLTQSQQVISIENKCSEPTISIHVILFHPTI